MIQSHLQLPTLVLISPLMIWGIWMISESSFDLWGPFTEKFPRMAREEMGKDRKVFRRRSIFLNFSLGFSTFLVGYFLIFIEPSATTPIFALAILIGALLIRWSGEVKRFQAKQLLLFEDELPTFMQLMTVLISSGVSPARAMDLLSRRSCSLSGSELRGVVDEIQQGKSVVQALDTLSLKYDSLVLRRFVTGIILGIERGSSLTPILVSQVKDARVTRKNQILQRAGKAEIGLMIPVVFLILPISILFALWPSYQSLGSFL